MVLKGNPLPGNIPEPRILIGRRGLMIIVHKLYFK